MVLELSDFVRAGNQAGNPAAYEIENAAIDHEGTLAEALAAAAMWEQRDLLDLGCGTGYWLPGYARFARSVVGVEPDPSLLAVATTRTGGAQVLHGSAEHIPLPDACVDVVHARFAYFFPPECDAGLAEVMRVLCPSGTLVVIDNDHRWGQFAELLAGSPWAAAQGSADVTDRWWAARGAHRREVRSSWQFQTRDDLETVLRLEFPPDIATRWLNEHRGATRLTYGYVLFVISRAP